MRATSGGVRRFLPASLLAVLAAVVGASLLAACSGADAYAPLPEPDPVATVPTSTTVQVDLDDVPLPAVEGTTTTVVAIAPGPVQRIFGRVDGPDGPVGGATVRLERLVGDQVATLDVPTAADGTWNVQHVLGGRYRVRAWRVPDLAMVRAKVLFVAAPESEPLVLQVERFHGTRVQHALAPSPPPVDEDVNLKVRVADDVVDEAGVVRTRPRPGVRVALAGTGRWFLRSPAQQTTDDAGSVTFRLVCRAPGSQPLSVVLDGTDVVPLDLPACVDGSSSDGDGGGDGDGGDDGDGDDGNDDGGGDGGGGDGGGGRTTTTGGDGR